MLAAYLHEIKCLIDEEIRPIQNSKTHLLYRLANEYEKKKVLAVPDPLCLFKLLSEPRIS